MATAQSATGKNVTVKVQADGTAPKGLKAGDVVETKGGNYKITGVNKDGTYTSQKVETQSTTSAANAAKAAAATANAAAREVKASKKSSSNSSVSTSPASTGYSATAAQNQAVQAAKATANTANAAKTSTATTSTGYQALGNYEDAEIRAAFPEAAAEIDDYKRMYDEAQKKGDVAKMQEAHSKAEAARQYYGSLLGIGSYSGGIDGSQKLATPQNTGTDAWPMNYDGRTTNGDYIDGVYVHPADQSKMSYSDLQTVIALKKEYATADPTRQKQINQEVENMRAKYGYSLGATGDQYKALELPEDTVPQMGLQTYTPQTEAVNNVYDKLNEATLQQLLASYNNSRAQTEHDMGKLPALYQAQRNAVSADNEREKAAFREQAAASGLTAGNRSQAALAYSNQLQNSLGQLNTAEANALADAQFNLTQLYNNYQQQIASAVAQNNYERAAALLQEYMTAQKSVVDTSVQQANLNLQVADFNRQTRLNNLSQQNADRDYTLNLANLLAGIGSYGSLGSLGGLTSNDVQTLQRQYLVQQLGQYYPILRGYL